MPDLEPSLPKPETTRSGNWKRIGITVILVVLVVISIVVVILLTGPNICCTNGGIYSNVLNSL